MGVTREALRVVAHDWRQALPLATGVLACALCGHRRTLAGIGGADSSPRACRPRLEHVASGFRGERVPFTCEAA